MGVLCHGYVLSMQHRDLKLENILLDHKGGDAAVKLVDFGLSALYEENAMSTDVLGSWVSQHEVSKIAGALSYVSFLFYILLHFCSCCMRVFFVFPCSFLGHYEISKLSNCIRLFLHSVLSDHFSFSGFYCTILHPRSLYPNWSPK